ncbi:LacI family DNA-binding transcriptional regulator [Brotaphodocola sp.]|uniref:LacI family DNA-binding transcriptional regulator n=1 Tax=Brotaphodocola sp. TaxID=3073577 RepID=UPI003D7C7925
MKIKMVDVARHLGISKATVSLAVHNKPGVNQETRQKVLDCIAQMEKNDGMIPESVSVSLQNGQPLLIKVVILNHQKKVVCDPELDLWSEVLATFDAQARKMGYLYGLTYVGEDEEEIANVIRECNLDLVAGVIVFGTEMDETDREILSQIHKPIVLYDCDVPDGRYSSVCINNYGTVHKALDYLRAHGADQIRYFSTDKNIYNFRKRREAFQNDMISSGTIPEKSDFVALGNTIPEITQNALNWFQTHPLPDGILLENYQVSIGTAVAVRKLGIRVPDQLKLIGIDEVPEYMASGIPFVQMKIPHAERAQIAMELLEKEIRGEWSARLKVFAESDLIE